MNPIEQAFAFKRLVEEFKLTHQELAAITGKSRSFITNTLRLLNLDEWVRGKMASGKITSGHGKVLLGIEEKQIQKEFGQKIMEQELSVRDSERLVERWLKIKDKKFSYNKSKIQYYPEIEKKLRTKLGTRVNVKFSGKKGKITIEFYSSDDLNRISGFILN